MSYEIKKEMIEFSKENLKKILYTLKYFYDKNCLVKTQKKVKKVKN